MELSKNAPCPCGSGNKYKKCCLNSLPNNLISYYGLLHKEGIIKEKLANLVSRFEDKELDAFAKQYKNTTFHNLKNRSKEEFIFFLDWLFFAAMQDNKKVLEILKENYTNFFENDELKIIDEWLNNTQNGIYEVQSTNEEQYTFILKEIYTNKQYEITDVKGSKRVVKGDIVAGRVQKIFSKYYLSGAVSDINRFNLEELKNYVENNYNNEKKLNPDLSYEDFINIKSNLIIEFNSKPPVIVAPDGEEVKVCTGTFLIKGNPGEVVNWFAKKDDFIVNEEEYNEDNTLKSANIVHKFKEEDHKFIEKEDNKKLVTSSYLINAKAEKIQILGNINIKDKELEIFSYSYKSFVKLKNMLLTNFGNIIQLKKEEIKDTRNIEKTKDSREDFSEEDDEKEIENKEIKQIELKLLEEHYKEWCDTKLPILNNQTPREAIKKENGRELVKRLIFDLENHSLREKKRNKTYIPVDKFVRKELNFYD